MAKERAIGAEQASGAVVVTTVQGMVLRWSDAADSERDAARIQARYGDLLETIPDGVVMMGPTGHVVFVNSRAEELFGYERGEMQGTLVDRLLPARFRAAHIAHRSRYFSTPRRRTMGAELSLSGLRKDGSEFPVEIALGPVEIRRRDVRHERDSRHHRTQACCQHPAGERTQVPPARREHQRSVLPGQRGQQGNALHQSGV